MAAKPPSALPPPGTLKAKLVNLLTRANVIVYRVSNGRVGGKMKVIVLSKERKP